MAGKRGGEMSFVSRNSYFKGFGIGDDENATVVQQILVRATVHPYSKEDMIRTDAFRGPLGSAFKLHLQDVSLFQEPES